jgi:hypothetical protein
LAPVPPRRIESIPPAHPLQALVWTLPSGNLTPPAAFSTPTVSTESARAFSSDAVTENKIALQMTSIDILLFMTVPPFLEKTVNYSMPVYNKDFR